MIRFGTSLIAIGLALVANQAAHAQVSSLFQRDLPAQGARPLTLADGSWYYRPPPPPKEVKLRDLVTILVTETAQSKSSGEVQRRKNGLYDAVLKDWLMLDGLSAIKPDLQADGDQRIQAQLNQLYRAEAEIETKELLRFNIAAEVVDIRPNGNLVLEARRHIRLNNENWEYALTGVCRSADIKPDNTVQSEDIAELSIYKREQGHVRDGYRRGWFTRWFDQLQPF